MIKKIKNNFLYKWISDIIDKYHILNKYRKYEAAKSHRKAIFKEILLSSLDMEYIYFITPVFKNSDNQNFNQKIKLPFTVFDRIKIFIKKLLHIKTKYHIR